MKTRLLLLVAIATLSHFSYAQFPGGGQSDGPPNIKGKISGLIVDGETGDALPYATVVLQNEKGREVSGDVTDENGKFRLTEIKAGDYRLIVSYIGYQTDTIKGITLSKKKPDFKIDKYGLMQDRVTLEAVEVVEERSLIENQLDKIVYNAEQDATNSNGDAGDVLRKVPMVAVDLEGNVSLRGSQNIRVLVNGKPSSMFSDNVADAMKMIPSEQVKKVEVMTNPSAKYDGEGSGGIINIITKQSKIKGFSGNVDLSAGTRQNSANVNLSLAQGRFGFNLGGFSFYSWPADALTSFERVDFLGRDIDPNRIMTQDGVTTSSRLGFNGRFGAFYDVNAYNSINTSVRIGGFTFDQSGTTNLRLLDPNQPTIEFDRINVQDRLTNNFDWTTDYTKKFETEGQELSFAFQLNGNQSNLESDLRQVAVIQGSPAFNELTFNDGDNTEYTAQVDYTHPFSKKVTLETGAKGVFRRIESDYAYFGQNLLTGVYLKDQERSNFFTYNQDVMAGYLSFNIKFTDQIGLVAGGRYEATEISGDFEEGQPIQTNTYENFLPSITLSKKFKNFSTVKFGYSQRIQRPSLFFLNPFNNDIDRFNVTTGNPNLDPELTNQFEVNYTTFIKGTIVNLSTYYKRTTDIITPVITIDDAVATTRYENAGINNSVGASLFTSVNLFKIWDIRTSFNIFTFDASGDVNGQTLDNFGIQYNGFVSSGVKLKKDWKIDVFSFYNSRRITLQGDVPSFSFFQVGINKELFEDKRGAIGIRIVEPFFERKSFKTNLEDPNFRQTSDFQLPFRSFGISFKYRFGKLDFQGQQRRSKIRNQDLKQGDDGGGQGGGGFGG